MKETREHILGMEPESVLKQVIRAHFAGQGRERAISVDDIVAVAMEFNKWLVDTNAILQKLTMERVNTELPAPILAHDAGKGEKRPINRPCSACGDGDTAMEYHLHEPPFADEPEPETMRRHREMYERRKGEMGTQEKSRTGIHRHESNLERDRDVAGMHKMEGGEPPRQQARKTSEPSLQADVSMMIEQAGSKPPTGEPQEAFRVTYWENGGYSGYKVSIPSYEGGMVVPLETYADLKRQLAEVRNENQRLVDAWMVDETIGTTDGRVDGSLRPDIRNTIMRAENAERQIETLHHEAEGHTADILELRRELDRLKKEKP